MVVIGVTVRRAMASSRHPRHHVATFRRATPPPGAYRELVCEFDVPPASFAPPPPPPRSGVDGALGRSRSGGGGGDPIATATATTARIRVLLARCGSGHFGADGPCCKAEAALRHFADEAEGGDTDDGKEAEEWGEEEDVEGDDDDDDEEEDDGSGGRDRRARTKQSRRRTS